MLKSHIPITFEITEIIPQLKSENTVVGIINSLFQSCYLNSLALILITCNKHPG